MKYPNYPEEKVLEIYVQEATQNTSPCWVLFWLLENVADPSYMIAAASIKCCKSKQVVFVMKTETTAIKK